MNYESELRAERPESDVEQPVTVPARGLRPWERGGPSPNPSKPWRRRVAGTSGRTPTDSDLVETALTSPESLSVRENAQRVSQAANLFFEASRRSPSRTVPILHRLISDPPPYAAGRLILPISRSLITAFS